MNRLTYKNYIDEYEVNFEKNSDKQWSIAESDTHIKITGEPIDKLGAFEDFMEENKFESLQHLKDEFEELKAGYDFIYEHGTDAINELKKENNLLRKIVDGVDKLKQYDVDVEDYILINPKTSYIDGISLDESMKLKQENKTLKDRWQKLKESILEFQNRDDTTEDDTAGLWFVIEKMQELEGEDGGNITY